MRVGYKVWLDNGGKAFGDGPYELLRRVEKMISLHRAASQMGMSYSKAWRLIRTLEEKLGLPLLERKVGGLSGGGSQVTPQARNLMNHYEGFRKDVDTSLKKIYRKHFHTSFGSPSPPPTIGRRSRRRTARTKGKRK